MYQHNNLLINYWDVFACLSYFSSVTKYKLLTAQNQKLPFHWQERFYFRLETFGHFDRSGTGTRCLGLLCSCWNLVKWEYEDQYHPLLQIMAHNHCCKGSHILLFQLSKATLLEAECLGWQGWTRRSLVLYGRSQNLHKTEIFNQ